MPLPFDAVAGYAVQGASLGLIAGISPGPLLALVVNLSLTRSAREGVKAAMAPLLTDLPILLCAVAAVNTLAASPAAMGLLGLAGGLTLAWYALESFRYSPVRAAADNNLPSSLLRGVIANFLNPSPYIFWAAIGAPLLVRASATSPWAALAFASSFFLCICGAKSAVALTTARSAAWLGSRGHTLMIRASGVLLLYYAASFGRDALLRLGLLS